MSSSNSNVLGIMVLIAVIMFIGVITFQVMELMHYQAG